jgi:hypothetical protein
MKLRQAKKIIARFDPDRPFNDARLGRAWRRIKRTKSEKELEQWCRENIVPFSSAYNEFRAVLDAQASMVARNALPASMVL